MAYAFNEDRSKIDVYTADEFDQMSDELFTQMQQEMVARATGDYEESIASTARDTATNARISNILDNQDLDPNKDSELVDIRTGYDGDVYTVAGDSVRAFSEYSINKENYFQETSLMSVEVFEDYQTAEDEHVTRVACAPIPIKHSTRVFFSCPNIDTTTMTVHKFTNTNNAYRAYRYYKDGGHTQVPGATDIVAAGTKASAYPVLDCSQFLAEDERGYVIALFTQDRSVVTLTESNVDVCYTDMHDNLIEMNRVDFTMKKCRYNDSDHYNLVKTKPIYVKAGSVLVYRYDIMKDISYCPILVSDTEYPNHLQGYWAQDDGAVELDSYFSSSWITTPFIKIENDGILTVIMKRASSLDDSFENYDVPAGGIYVLSSPIADSDYDNIIWAYLRANGAFETRIHNNDLYFRYTDRMIVSSLFYLFPPLDATFSQACDQVGGTYIEDLDEDGVLWIHIPNMYALMYSMTTGLLSIQRFWQKDYNHDKDKVILFAYSGHKIQHIGRLHEQLLYDIDQNKESATQIILRNEDSVYAAEALAKAYFPNNRLKSPLNLLHFTDIHGEWGETQMRNINMLKDKLAPSINDAICTGDMMAVKSDEGMTLWDARFPDGDILTCVGNHDARKGDSDIFIQTPGSYCTEQEKYELYIEPYYSNWGASARIVENEPYYSKVYNTAKFGGSSPNILMVVIDSTLKDSAGKARQISWFEQELAYALSNNLAVLGVSHYPPGATDLIKVESNFTTYSSKPNIPSGTPPTWDDLDLEYCALVKSFVQSGGEFICWLSGHQHNNIICYADGYPEQLFIVSSSAYISSGYNTETRKKGTKSEDCFNVVSIDRNLKQIRLVRFGAIWDSDFRKQEFCVIDYDPTHIGVDPTKGRIVREM